MRNFVARAIAAGAIGYFVGKLISRKLVDYGNGRYVQGCVDTARIFINHQSKNESEAEDGREENT